MLVRIAFPVSIGTFSKLLATTLVSTPAFAAPVASASRAETAENGRRAEAGEEQPGLDPGIRKMIDAAIESGDEATTTKVLALARQVAPDSRPEIDALEATWAARRAARKAEVNSKRLAKLRSATIFRNWKGEAEFGAYRSTGTTSNLGFLGSLKLEREGFRWTHKLTGRLEAQSTNGETTAERLFASWQPQLRISPSAYVFSIAQYERDPFAGYEDRYTLSGGVGFRPASDGALLIELEGGPAFRHIEETDGPSYSRMAGRGSLGVKWQVTPTLNLSHRTAVYLESGHGNAVANTQLDTKVIGALKARFSYNVQYEGSPPVNAKSLNTQSRATFVYSF